MSRVTRRVVRVVDLREGVFNLVALVAAYGLAQQVVVDQDAVAVGGIVTRPAAAVSYPF